MAVAPEAEALLRRVYDAFNRKDLETALSIAHPEVDWPNQLEQRREVGVSDVVQFLERQFRVIDTQMHVLSIDEADDGAVSVRVHQVSRFLSDGAVLSDEVFEHVYRLRDGLVVSVDVRDADGTPLGPGRRTTEG